MLGPHTSSEALALDWYDDLRAADPLDRTLAHDVAHYLADDLLVKSDIASMAHSLELRSPFLDHKVLEFAAVLPAAWKVKGLKQTKYILREVAKTLVPASVLKRRKRGFSPPVSEWFRTTHSDWLRQILLDRRALDRGIWNEPAVARLIDDHAARRQDHGKRLWALLVLELWFQTYMDTAGWSKRKAA